MSVKSADNSFDHLYPDFRAKLAKVLEETSEATGNPWYMAEGYRSPERQLWLYAQGRTRPGRIVTWMRTPKYHGTGLAADCYPRVANLDAAPAGWFRTFRDIYHRHGLSNPAWSKGDMGHVQLDDPDTRIKALAWVRAGFPQGPKEPPQPEVRVYVNGREIEDADATLRNGHVYLWLRPVVDALGWSVAEIKDGKAEVVGDEREVLIPLEVSRGRGYTEARELRPLLTKLEWIDATKKLFLVD